MNKTLLQQRIDLFEECKRQNKMLQKLIELNINDLQDIADQRDKYKIGHDRYEKLRRLSPMQFHELYEKNIKTGEHFDKLVDKL